MEIVEKISKIAIIDDEVQAVSSAMTTDENTKPKKYKAKPKSKSKNRKNVVAENDVPKVNSPTKMKHNENDSNSLDSKNSPKKEDSNKKLPQPEQIPFNSTYVVQKVANQNSANSNDDFIFKKPKCAISKKPKPANIEIELPKRTQIPKPISLDKNGISKSKETSPRKYLQEPTTESKLPIPRENVENQILKPIQINDAAERCGPKAKIQSKQQNLPQKKSTKNSAKIPPNSILVYSPSKCNGFQIRQSDKTVSITIDHMVQTIGMENLKSLFKNEPFRKFRCDSNKRLWFIPGTDATEPKWSLQ